MACHCLLLVTLYCPNVHSDLAGGSHVTSHSEIGQWLPMSQVTLTLARDCPCHQSLWNWPVTAHVTSHSWHWLVTAHVTSHSWHWLVTNVTSRPEYGWALWSAAGTSVFSPCWSPVRYSGAKLDAARPAGLRPVVRCLAVSCALLGCPLDVPPPKRASRAWPRRSGRDVMHPLRGSRLEACNIIVTRVVLTSEVRITWFLCRWSFLFLRRWLKFAYSHNWPSLVN